MKRFLGILLLTVPSFAIMLGFHEEIKVGLLFGVLALIYLIGVVLGIQSFNVYQKWPSKYSYWYLAIGILLVVSPLIHSLGANKEPDIAIHYVFVSVACAMLSVVIVAYYLIMIDFKVYRK